MTRRILTLTLVQGVVVGIGLAVLLRDGWVPSPSVPGAWFVGYTVVVTVLTLLPPVMIEHRRHATSLTPADAAIPVGLVVLGPLGFLAASMIVEVVLVIRLRSPAIKTLFNLVSMLGGFVAAAVTFDLLGRSDPSDPATWAAVIAALAACSLWDIVSTSGVLAIVEGDRLPHQLARNAPPILLGLVVAAAMGLIAVLLLVQRAVLLLLLLPVLGVLYASSRGIAQQTAERERFEQLYEASDTLAELMPLPEVLARVADQAAGFVTGTVAAAWLVRDEGAATGRLVDHEGAHVLSVATRTALERAYPPSGGGELGPIPAQGRSAAVLPDHGSVVWASHRAEPVGTLIIAVLRDLPADAQGASRSDVLAAFAAHAATVVANVELYQEVREALVREVERNREKSEFVATVSHELRTPLAAVLGSMQTFRRLGPRLGPEKTERLVEIALSEGGRLQRLIEDLLLVAAGEHARLQSANEPVDLRARLQESADALVEQTEGRLVVTLADDLGVIISDADKLHRIVDNLVGNAAKYAPQGPIELTAVRDARQVTIAVSDHGPGIAREDRDRVFERFVQLDQSSTRRRGGTGLGLHLSRELARLLGGTLELGSAASGGARFELKIPVAGADDRGRGTDGSASVPNGQAASGTGVRQRPSVLERPAHLTGGTRR